MEEKQPKKECRHCHREINRESKICPFCFKNQEIAEGAGRTAVRMFGYEVMKDSLSEDEQKFFKKLFNRLTRRYGLYEIEDKIALERILKNYIKILRIESEIAKEGIIQTYIDKRTGETKQRIHPSQSLINQWESKLLDWLKAMSLTRSKRQLKNTTRKDFANWMTQPKPRIIEDDDEIGTDTEGDQAPEEKPEKQ